MQETSERHTRRLQVVCAALLASLAAYAGLVTAVPLAVQPTFPQGEPLLWGFAFLAAVNLVTIMPVYRAMLAGPRRVYAVGQQPERLLAAHFSAHIVAFARLEAVAILGLVLHFLTGRQDWFWIFTGVAAFGMVLLWPKRGKVEALLALPGQSGLQVPSPQ
ncbi:MAG TPA: hypothetical protein VI700_05390 [Thermoanaerobaculaceae bacterium]|nr:hypothetical protein [Thermoanaerobaculaceae bacterium]